MADAVTADRCPGLLRLHEAADGLLARIRFPGGRVSAAALDALAAAAAFGAGELELTSRASLQVRGLRAADAESAVSVIVEAGLLPSPAHDRVRNILASPLAGRHPRSLATTDDVVAELDRRLCADPEIAALPGRFLFAVDDGAGLVGGPVADVALLAIGPQRFRLVADGREAEGLETAVTLALDAAREALATRRSERPPASRGERLTPGVLGQRDGRFAVTCLPPLGRLTASTASAVAALLREERTELRVSTWRTLTLVDVPGDRCQHVLGALGTLGLVLDPDSGWTGLSACAGLGRCVKARADVRAAAARRAAVRRPGAPTEHWAACERRCGLTPGVAVAVTADEDGVLVEEVVA